MGPVAVLAVVALASILVPPTAAQDTSPLVLRPGDTLLDHLSAWQVQRFAETNLRPRVAAALGELLDGGKLTVDESAWIQGPTFESARQFARILRVRGEVHRWRTRPPAHLDLALGVPWFTHEGRAARHMRDVPGAEQAASRRIYWFDEARPMLFWWDPESGFLRALGKEPPGPVDFGFLAARGPGADHWEWGETRGETSPATAADLARRASLAEIDRPCVSAPAPTRFAIEVDAFEGDALHVAMAVVDLGVRLRRERLERVDGLGDGVTFAVDVRIDGETRRIWSRHVAPGGGFVEDVVDLSGFTGRRLTLRLVTLPGPADDASFDYALWGDLRVAGTPRGRPDRPHVVIIDVDTLRADRLGCYGAARPTSPRIDAWAARSATLYTNMTSANDWTLPSTVSMLTGLSVAQHGVHAFPGAVTAEHEPLAVRLRAAGYETYARTDGGFLNPAMGFAVGFDVFDYRRETPEEHQRIGWTRELARLRDRRSDRPVFYFLQTYQVHAPFRVDDRFEDPERPYDGPLVGHDITPEVITQLMTARGIEFGREDRAYVSRRYDAGVRRMDDVVGDFLDGIAEVFEDEEVLIVFTSDHGEELGERGRIGHGHSLHGELIEVPLIVQYPGGEPPGADDAAVSTVDIVPTILDVIGLDAPDHLPGQSLRALSDRTRLRFSQHADTAHAVQWRGYKLIVGSFGKAAPDRPRRLYRLADDPLEMHDVAADNGKIVERLDHGLREFLEGFPPLDTGDRSEIPVDEAVLDDLRALGYLR